jgi:cobalt-zinc-cadmium efflux system outer membrane protein
MKHCGNKPALRTLRSAINTWRAISIGTCMLLAAFPACAADLRHLSLADAEAMASSGNRDLHLAALAISSAQAAMVTADAAPNPTLSIQSASINPHTGIGAGNWRSKTVDTTIRIDQTIERGGKREWRREAALRQEDAARADHEDTTRQVRLDVALAYYDLLAAQERVTIALETVRLFEQTLDAAMRRKKAGDLAGADADRIMVDAMKAKSDSRQAQTDLDHARMALAVLIGQPREVDAIAAGDSWPTARQFASPENIDEMVEARADVKAARARLEAAQASRRLALASRTRDVSVGVQFEHDPAGNTNPSGSGNSYGVAIQIPLFLRYQFDGEIRAAESAADRLRHQQDGALQAASRAADAAEYAFRNGALGVMDVLDARRSYRVAQLDALSARTDFAKALAAWRIAAMEDKNP